MAFFQQQKREKPGNWASSLEIAWEMSIFKNMEVYGFHKISFFIACSGLLFNQVIQNVLHSYFSYILAFCPTFVIHLEIFSYCPIFLKK